LRIAQCGTDRAGGESEAAAVTDPDTLADRLMLLVDGAIVTAHVEGDELAAARGPLRGRLADGVRKRSRRVR
jgi:hypothetical protein